MAKNDIELSVGLKLDESQFQNSYTGWLSKTTAETQKQVGTILDDTKGAAAKQWGPLPYYLMHDNSVGARTATMAFLPSLGRDLNAAGYASDSVGYQSAMINAAYRSSMADPMQRFHRMYATGLTQQADLTHPDTALGKAIETDYQLMSQPWSRDFIRTVHGEALDAEVLKKSKVADLRKQGAAMGLKGLSDKKKADVISAMVSKSKESSLEFDFEGMRKYAVDAGLGRWVDEDKGNTADNFELINDELEKIEDKSDKTKKLFTGWNDDLKGVLGTLTAIGGIAGIAKTFEVAYNASESGTVTAAGRLSNQRVIVGMTAMDELRTKLASKAASLGENAIRDEIYSMSDKTQLYKMLGKGDMLPQALLGIFQNMMSSDNPYDTYIKSADQLYEAMRGMDDDGRQRYKMLLTQAGLGSMADLIGIFLSNPEFAKEYKTPSALFDLKQNPFYSSYERAETLLPNITKTKESLQASYNEMYTLWEQAFGGPFRDWWDEVMKDKVVPWFQKIVSFLGGQGVSSGAVTELSMILFSSDRDKVLAGAVDKDNRLANVPGYKKQTGPIGGHTDWGSWFGGQVNQVGAGARNLYDLYGQVAAYSDAEIARMKATDDQKAATADIVHRIQYMRKKYYETGLENFITNGKKEDIDKYLLRAMQVGVYGDADTWQANFDAYVDKLLGLGTRGETDDKIIALLETIAQNTEMTADLKENKDFWNLVEKNYGTTVANQWRNGLTNRN